MTSTMTSNSQECKEVYASQDSQDYDDENAVEWKGFELPTLTDDFVADNNGFLTKTTESYDIIHTPIDGVIRYFSVNHNMELWRQHNDAYLIKKNDNSYVLKIVDHVQESEEWSIGAYKMILSEYEDIFEEMNVSVSYMYCVDSAIMNKLDPEGKDVSEDDAKRYITRRRVLGKDNIKVLCNEDDDYITKLNAWVNDC